MEEKPALAVPYLSLERAADMNKAKKATGWNFRPSHLGNVNLIHHVPQEVLWLTNRRLFASSVRDQLCCYACHSPQVVSIDSMSFQVNHILSNKTKKKTRHFFSPKILGG